jgi:hypothetical protein
VSRRLGLDAGFLADEVICSTFHHQVESGVPLIWLIISDLLTLHTAQSSQQLTSHLASTVFLPLYFSVAPRCSKTLCPALGGLYVNQG